jgi:hypothetical protein
VTLPFGGIVRLNAGRWPAGVTTRYAETALLKPVRASGEMASVAILCAAPSVCGARLGDNQI